MEIDHIVEILLEMKLKYPNLSNMELIELLKVKTMMEAKAQNG